MFIPNGDRIAVVVAAREEVSAGGIHLPERHQEKPQQGTVIAVGPGRYELSGEEFVRVPMDTEVGDVVVFNKHSGFEAKVDGQSVLIMSERDVLGLFKGGV